MKKFTFTAAMVLLALFFVLGIFVSGYSPEKDEDASAEQLTETERAEEAADSQRQSAEEVSADLAAIFDEYFAETGVDTSMLGISVYDFESGGSYALNDTVYFTAASTYKLPLAMLYYEKINDRTYALSDGLLYEAYHYEEGGTIAYDYLPGSYISIEELLHCLIIDSDNTAGHILYENLGGWQAFKEAAAKYSDTAIAETDSEYYSGENEFTAAYMEDVLDYLHTNADDFETLLDDMQQAMPDDYLNMYIGDGMAQKYGQYDMAENAVGISMSGHPYSIAVFTSLGYTGRLLIGDVNELLWQYFNAATDNKNISPEESAEAAAA